MRIMNLMRCLLSSSLALAGIACSSNDSTPFASGAGGAGGVSLGGQSASGGFPVSVPGGSGGSTASAGGVPGVFTVGPVQNDTCSDQDINVLFLIDRSGSMNCNLPPTTASADCEAMSPPAKVDAAQPSKWEIISQTLSQSLAELAMLDGSVHVRAGISFFSVDGVCSATSTPTVPVDVATQAQLDTMTQTLAKQTPKGGTPIVGATVLAYKHLYQTLAVTNAHVILITDGKDSCGEYYAAQPSIGSGDQVAQLIANQAPTALNVGIKTWVIGAPGSEVARATLSSLAVAGGTRRTDGCTPGNSADPTVGDCHYDMTTGDFQQTLSAALHHILQVVTCRSIR
jgi:hypothetical protein